MAFLLYNMSGMLWGNLYLEGLEIVSLIQWVIST